MTATDTQTRTPARERPADLVTPKARLGLIIPSSNVGSPGTELEFAL